MPRISSTGFAFFILLSTNSIGAQIPDGIPSKFFLPAQENDKWGYKPRFGNEFVIKPQFQLAAPFSEDLAAIKIDGKYGYIDRKGEIVIKPQFDFASPFSEGRAAVKMDKTYKYIDKKGSVALQVDFPSVGPFTEGLAWNKIVGSANDPGKYGFIDRNGKQVIEPIFEAVAPFSNGLALVKKERLYGYIDLQGKIVIKPTFEAATSFSRKLAAVRKESKYGYIDTSGEWVIKPQFKQALPFSERLAAVRTEDKFGFIDPKGKFVIEERYDSVISATSVEMDGSKIQVGAGCRGREMEVFVFDPNPKGKEDHLKISSVGKEVMPFVKVELSSVPDDAEVHAIPLYDYEGADETTLLSSGDYRVQEGNTDTKTNLDKTTVYQIIFVYKDQKERRKCKPLMNPQIKVKFK